MDRPTIFHDDEEWYVNYHIRRSGSQTQAFVRNLESVSTHYIRARAPEYKHSEIRQKIQDLHGTEIEVVF